MKRCLILMFFVGLLPRIVLADVCDYRPSSLIGGSETKAVVATSASVAGSGLAMKAAGTYVITNATTGTTMLGSTMAGTSAAGTVGIVSGSAGTIGTIGAILMSPFVIIPAVVATFGLGVYEGGCYLVE